jgi:hypothetical protein
MYCPNCSAPIDGVKFCRSCGVNVSLVPQAMTGRLPAQPDDAADQIVVGGIIGRKHNKHKKPPSLAKGIQEIFAGLGFIFVALAVNFWGPAGHLWWYWMLIPAFSTLGSGVAEIVRAKQAEQATRYNMPVTPPPSAPRAIEMPATTTSKLAPPPSIVEDTTRRFDPAERSSEKR